MHDYAMAFPEEIQLGTCDGKEFDIAKERCCVHQLYKVKTGSDSCCDWKLFDTTTEQCCNGFVIDSDDVCHYHNPLKYNLITKTDE